MANIQFNSKDAKGFRMVCEKFYKAIHIMAEKLARYSDDYKSAKTIYDNAVADKVAIENGEYDGHRDISAIEADIATFGQKMTDAKDAMSEVRSAQEDAIKAGKVLYTDAMHKAAAAVVGNFGSESALNEWRTALADMLVANGVTDATPENVSRFDFCVNTRKKSQTKIVIDGTAVGVGNKSTSAEVFMCVFVEYLTAQGIISPYKHKYVPMAEKKRLERLAAKSAQ